MVAVASLWLPILVSAVLVFVASSIIHMVLGYHQKDYGRVPKEDGFMEAVRGFSIPPGDYFVPRASSAEDMKKPEFVEKMTKGPVVFMTVIPPGPPSMGKNLALWFVYCVAVGIFAGYVAGLVFGPGAEYRPVFRIVSTVAFVGYSLALVQNSIWYSRNWGTTFRSMFDGLVYGLLSGGAFGWLWPDA